MSPLPRMEASPSHQNSRFEKRQQFSSFHCVHFSAGASPDCWESALVTRRRNHFHFSLCETWAGHCPNSPVSSSSQSLTSLEMIRDTRPGWKVLKVLWRKYPMTVYSLSLLLCIKCDDAVKKIEMSWNDWWPDKIVISVPMCQFRDPEISCKQSDCKSIDDNIINGMKSKNVVCTILLMLIMCI